MIATVIWGSVSVNNQVYKDVQLAPGYVSEWDWKACKTSHDPGVTRHAVESLLKSARGPVSDVILSTGFHRKLQVSTECREFLSASGLHWWIVPTTEAVRLYNQLCKDPKRQPAALIHSTC